LGNPDIATFFTKKRVFCLEKIGKTDIVQKEIINARTRLAIFYSYGNHWIEAKDALAPIVSLAEELSLLRNLAFIFNILGAYYFNIAGEAEEGFRCFRKALKFAEEIKDPVSTSSIGNFFGSALALAGRFDEASIVYDETMNRVESGGDIGFLLLLKAQKSFFIHLLQGDIGHGYKLVKEVLDLAGKQDEQANMLAFCVFGYSCFCLGRFDDAEKNLLKAITLLEKAGNNTFVTVAAGCLGEIFLLKKAYKKSWPYFEKAFQAAERYQSPETILLCEIQMAKARVLSGQEIDINELIRSFDNTKMPMVLNKAYSVNTIGEILLFLEDRSADETKEWILKAIEVNTSNGVRFFRGRSYHLYSEFYQKQNNLPQAREQMNKAIDIMKECGADGWVDRYEKELADLN